MNNNNNSGNRQVARRGEGNDREEEDSGPSWWSIGLGLAVGVATVAGGIYMISRLQEEQGQQRKSGTSDNDDSDSDDSGDEYTNDFYMDDTTDAISRLAVSPKPVVNNLNSLLNDIYVRYIAIRKEEFGRRYNVFKNVFNKLHKSMTAVDSYYERYSSRHQFRPDEFNMYIVIRLPVNMYEDYRNPEDSDIVIEPKHASFVQLRAGEQYLNMIIADVINSAAYKWLDDRKYILRSKFVSWFQSVVDRALNRLQRTVKIDGIDYKMTTSSKDGAYTLWITNSAGFRLYVDLIPALRFPEERWLGSSKAYREIPSGCNVGYWMALPKPNKSGANTYDEERSWHVDLYEQEKEFTHNSFHLRQGIRFLKKLRDAQQMIHIDNYVIATIFLWKSLEVPKSFWQSDMATVFKVMLKELYEALARKKIAFFWKKTHNLIERVPEHILKGYARKLSTLLTELEDETNYKVAAEYLLTDLEYTDYKSMLCWYSN